MPQLEPYPTIDTLEEDLGNPNLLQIFLIVTILTVTIFVGLGIDWLKKLYGYFKNYLRVSTTNYANK